MSEKKEKNINKKETKKTDIKKTTKKDISVNSKKKFGLAELEEAMKTKQAFEVYVKDVDAFGNLKCIFASGIEAVMPRDEIIYTEIGEKEIDLDFCNKKKDKVMTACIKDIKSVKSKIIEIILSRKELELKVRKWMYNNLKPGMKLKGVVRGMNDFMAFVDIGGGVIGTIKISEISNIKLQKVSDKLHLGKRIECTVIKFDKDTGKIELSIKGKKKSFKAITARFKEGDIVEAVVRNRIRNGIFIELSNDLIAMADHISGIEYGQKVLVYIKRISEEKEKVKVEIIG